MPAVEIDEVELARLRKQDTTVHALLANPKSKRKLFEAVKEADPAARVPELDAEEAAKQPVVELQQKFDALAKSIEDERAEREKNAKLNALDTNINEGLARLRRSGWTDEGIASVRKVMDEKGIVDVDVAAAYYEKVNPPAEPTNPRSGVGGWGFAESVQDDEKDLKLLLDSKGNNEAIADKMARDALKEFRGAQRR